MKKMEANQHHNPGPWHAQHRVIQDGKGGSQRYHILAGPDRRTQICSMPGWDEDDQANAFLVAASPDLLKACEVALAVLRFYENGPVSELVAKAIHKAKEGQ